jgi:hypothetical protein
LVDRQWTEEFTADKTIGDVRARLKATGADVAALAVEEQILDDRVILAFHLFQNKSPLSVAVIQVDCPLVVGCIQFQIHCNRSKPVSELRQHILSRFRFTGDDVKIQFGGLELADMSDLQGLRNFSTFSFNVVCQGEVCQRLTFQEVGNARLIGPLDFPLDATMDDVLRRLQQERAGTYLGLPHKALNEIPIPSEPIQFEFQAPVVNQVNVILLLPPNDVMHKADFPDTSAVGDVLKYAMMQFTTDPAKTYGARESDELDDDNWYPPDARLAEFEAPIYLWIREVPTDKLPLWCPSTSQALPQLPFRAGAVPASRSGPPIRAGGSGPRSGLNSPRVPQ